MRFDGRDSSSRSIKFAILWAADYSNEVFLDLLLTEFLRKLALRASSAWPSFGSTQAGSAYGGKSVGAFAASRARALDNL
jgi:hypothetical protein